MPRTDAHRHRGLIAVIASMVIVNLVYGLTLPLLSLVLDAQGISKTVIGLSIVAQACAGVVIAPFASRLIQRLGAGHAMQAATVLAAAMLIALGMVQNVYAWFPMRFMLGAAAAILWSASVLYTGMWGAGTMIGPLVVGAGMDLLGNESMPYLIAGIFACYLPTYWYSRQRLNLAS